MEENLKKLNIERWFNPPKCKNNKELWNRYFSHSNIKDPEDPDIINKMEKYSIKINNYFKDNGYYNKDKIHYVDRKIKTYDKKQIYFDVLFDAKVDIFVSKNDIQKGDELSTTNIKKQTIQFERFLAKPLISIPKHKFQAKHSIKKDKIF